MCYVARRKVAYEILESALLSGGIVTVERCVQE